MFSMKEKLPPLQLSQSKSFHCANMHSTRALELADLSYIQLLMILLMALRCSSYVLVRFRR